MVREWIKKVFFFKESEISLDSLTYLHIFLVNF